jgi:hypothetical protein
MINFLAEISREIDTLIVPIRTNRIKNFYIFEIDIRIPNTNTYWSEWGGTYNNFRGNDLELYYEGHFLVHADNPIDLTMMEFSMYNDGNGFVLINIPIQYWFYEYPEATFRELHMFTHSAINPDEPSNTKLGMDNAQTRLQLPSLTVKLSDNFNGVSLNQGFSVNLMNNDGYFDDDDYWFLFNTPFNLKKSIVDVPTYQDFIRIRSGLIDYVSTDFDGYKIQVADKFSSLENPVCKIISKNEFPELTVVNSTLGKALPVLYGYGWVKLLKLDDTHYAAAEKTTALYRVIDKDGAAISSGLNNNVITVPANSKPDSAYIRGYEIQKIGNIIKHLMERAKILYVSTYWDVNETDRYLNNSKSVNFLITSGSIKKAIQDALMNDMAYLLQKPNDKFTIRKYGEKYKTHYLSPEIITKKPEKDYSKAQENYFSSCIIEYIPNGSTNMATESSFHLYNINEYDAIKKYKRNKQKSFKTTLTNENDVIGFGKLLSDRYSFLKQKIKLSVGIDTSQMSLLDSVEIDLSVNERQFSNKKRFVITEVNPAQDILTLEEIDY